MNVVACSVLEKLYRDQARNLCAYARKRVGSHEAEDVVRDAFLKLLQEGRATDCSHPKAYLFRVASNTAVDALRRQMTRARYLSGEGAAQSGDVAEPAPMIESRIAVAQLESLLDELPPPCRNAFLCYWLDEMSQSEIARYLGVTVRTVERRLAKALEHLRDRTRRAREEAS